MNTSFKKMIAGLMILMLMTIAAGCSPKAIEAPKQTAGTTEALQPVTIGVTQIVTHPSLDQIRQGLIDGLKAAGYEEGKTLTIDFQNAEGSMDTAQLIAQRFESAGNDLNIGITTPCAQTLYQTVTSSPILFSAVTDPTGAGLKGDKITGISDRTPVEKQLNLLQALLPEAKVIGMIYNSSEQNSVIQMEEAVTVAETLGMSVEAVAITGTNDMGQALESVLKKADVFYAQVDNTVASAFPLVIQKTRASKVPVIGSVSQYVIDGALAADGIDNYDIGLQTAAMAVKVLQGTPVSALPFETVKETQLTLNTKTAEAFGIVFTKEMLDRGKLIQ